MCKSVHLICKYDAIYARCLSITHLQRVGRAWENHRYRGTTVINILGLYSWWKLVIWELVTCLMSLRGASDEHDIKYKQRGSKSTPNSPNYGAKAKTKGSNPYLFLFSVDPPRCTCWGDNWFSNRFCGLRLQPQLSWVLWLLFPEKLGHPKAKLESEFPLLVLDMQVIPKLPTCPHAVTVRAFSDRETPKTKPTSPHLLPDVASHNFCWILVSRSRMMSPGCVDRKETHQAGMVRAEFMEGVFEAARLWTIGNWKNQKWTTGVSFKSKSSKSYFPTFTCEKCIYFAFLFLFMNENKLKFHLY